jgi:hypothetical protein
MAEYVRQQGVWKESSPGAMLDTSVVRRELFLLLSIVLADKTINTTLQDNRIPPFANEHLIEEITRLLAITASILRARDDYAIDEDKRSGEGGDWLRELRSQACGTLQPDIANVDSVPLTMREACNKIIHATTFRFDVEGEFETSYMNPVIYFYGTERGKPWRAVLDIVRYVDVGISYTDWT